MQFDDGRETELLQFVQALAEVESIRGSPARVIEAIDRYARTKKYLMNVGSEKGKIVGDLIAQEKPRIMVELGGYLGYSAILFGDALRQAGGLQYHSLERNPEFGRVISALVDLAGLGNIVKVHVGPSDVSLAKLHSQGELKSIDLMFLDHYKPAYLTDLKLCEHLKLIGPGSVLAADNVIKPGNPPYLAYVRSSVEEKRKKIETSSGSGYSLAGFSDRSQNQYKETMGDEKPNLQFNGNPNLVYESTLIHSREPTGVPVRIWFPTALIPLAVAALTLG